MEACGTAYVPAGRCRHSSGDSARGDIGVDVGEREGG